MTASSAPRPQRLSPDQEERLIMLRLAQSDVEEERARVVDVTRLRSKRAFEAREAKVKWRDIAEAIGVSRTAAEKIAKAHNPQRQGGSDAS